MRSIITGSILLAFLALGCGGDSNQKIPPKPINGSPVAAEFVKFIKGKRGDGVRVHLYNFGDKTAVAYVIVFRYYDEAGNLLKVKPGTPFEKDTDFMSLSGRSYKCGAKKHATIDVDMLNVPKEAKRAEALVTKVRSTPDGMKIEDWWSQENWSEWPETK